MIRTIHSEWIKLRTVTMNWVLGAVTVALPLLVTVLTAVFTSDDRGEYSTRVLLDGLTGTAVVTGLLHGIIAAAGVTGEFGFGTIRPTLAATPSRLRVVAAKVVVAVAVACALTTVVSLVSYLASSAVAEGNDVTIDLAEVSGGQAALLGAVGYAGLLAIIGVGLGLLVRSTPAAVTILLAWPLVVEGLVGGIAYAITGDEDVAEWFPFRSGFRMLQLVSEFGGADEPGRAASSIVFAGFAALVLALGTWSFSRRDA